MNPGLALRSAGRDLFQNSWRLVPVNAALGAVLVAVAVLTVAVHALLLLAVLAGPVALALLHAAVVLARTGNVALADAWEGLRLHRRRGLELGAAALVLGVAAGVAIHFYTRFSFGWPLAFATVYLVVLLGIQGLVVATVGVAAPELTLRAAAREAVRITLGRPGPTLRLGLVLLLVNVTGLAAGVMPFLTLTVAYSFVAVAHFVLPRQIPEGS